jgi:DNA-3-methyladenine glycosylase
VAAGRRLPRSFYARKATDVAPDLLGRLFVRMLPGGVRLVARIVETEAYTEGDPASHSYRGRTPRNEVMFGRAGFLYVYFTYGMHFCMNVVTGMDGEGSAVLLRAAEPMEGVEEMARRRGTADALALCSGPARWAEAFEVARGNNGADLVRGPDLYVLEGERLARSAIARTTRVGVTVGADRRWRFLVKGDPYVSRGRPASSVRD